MQNRHIGQHGDRHSMPLWLSMVASDVDGLSYPPVVTVVQHLYWEREQNQSSESIRVSVCNSSSCSACSDSIDSTPRSLRPTARVRRRALSIVLLNVPACFARRSST